MRSPGSTSCATAFALLCATAAASVARLASQPIDYIYGHLAVDDAIYYVKPALQLFAGNGYAFDGVNRSNGVQPLWAMVVAGLVGLLRDPAHVVRAMVLLGGLLWIAAAILLHRLVARLHALGALLAGALFLLAGLESRLALQGMENGLHAVLLVMSLQLAHRHARSANDPGAIRTLRWLGITTGLLALARIEYALCAALLGAWLLLAELRRGPATAAMRRLAPFAFPLLAIGGTWLLFSRAYFGEWTPISGSVKLWHNQRNPALGGLQDRLANIGHLVVLRAFAGVLIGLFTWIGWITHRLAAAWEIYALLGVALAPLLCGAPALWRRLGGPPLWNARAVAMVLAVFISGHVLLLAAYLSAFAGYCGWYLTGEILAICLLLGGLAGALRGTALACAAPACLVIAAAIAARVPTWFTPIPTWITEPYVRIGRHVERWLPAPATIGAYGSGYIALEARSHRVVNLDGLMNDGRYLREYLQPKRIRDYFRDERIGYVADYLPAWQWRRHLRGEQRDLPEELRPIHCIPAKADWFACVFATNCGAPELPVAPPHPLARQRVLSLLLDELPLIPDHARAALPSDRVIVSTFVVPPRDVVHLAVARDLLAGVVDPAGFAGLRSADVPFGDRLVLRAVELPGDRVVAGDRCVITTYWQARPDIADGTPLELRIEVAGLTCAAPPLLGTLPIADWPAGVVLPHAFVVDLPADLPGGTYPVRIGVRAADAELAPDDEAMRASQPIGLVVSRN